MSDDIGFHGLVALVQYREAGKYGFWHNMAAFDNLTVAERYSQQCAEGCSIFEYRAVPKDPS